jgi:FAD:protein FMN transferase
MTSWRKVILPLGLAAAATLPFSAPIWGATIRVGQPVMGTILEVVIVAVDEAKARRLADAAVAEARRWDDVLTTWRSEGELAGLNARAGRGPFTIGADLAEALRTMQRLSLATGGAFDPAVGRLVRLWSDPAPPSRELLVRLRAQSIARALTVDGRTATLAAGVALDAGGIGKGIALDAIASMLRHAGVTTAFLDFGGSSQLAVGAPPDAAQGWRVLLAGLERGSARGVLALRDAALSTSRSTGPGAKEGPIIDPRRGEPVTERRVATVLASDATTAEAWSTALVVRGRAGLAGARAAGLELFYEDGEGPFSTEKVDAGLRSPTPDG